MDAASGPQSLGVKTSSAFHCLRDLAPFPQIRDNHTWVFSDKYEDLRQCLAQHARQLPDALVRVEGKEFLLPQQPTYCTTAIGCCVLGGSACGLCSQTAWVQACLHCLVAA